MRLLRADTEELKLEIVKEEDAKYAILSHRWLADEEEVTFNDLAHGGCDVRAKEGWKKLEYCKRQALQDGVQYVWMDTCCIDKSSSQELTESINSMYRWYQNAECCYVYLHDIQDLCLDGTRPNPSDCDREGQGTASICNAVAIEPRKTTPYMHGASAYSTTIKERTTALNNMYDPAQIEIDLGVSVFRPEAPKRWSQAMLKECEWFKRGWTLQEMLASRQLKFYSSSWDFIAEMPDIASDISIITGVHKEALTHERDVRSYSIAQRMSWAAGRLTTRLEDRAYSLLGLLDVSIGIIYGEGNRAFQRLQDELLRTTSDQSIFAFERPSGSRHKFNLLADSPDCFDTSRDIILTAPNRKDQFQTIGREIHFSLLTIDPDRRRLLKFLYMRWSKRGDRFMAILNCCPEYDRSKLVVLNFSSDYHDMSYVRLRSDVNRMERVDALAIRKGRVQQETFKVMQRSDAHSSNRHWVTIRCLITSPLSVTPDVLPEKSIWIRDSNTLTIPCSDRIGMRPWKQIPDLSLLISLNCDRARSRLRISNGRILIENGFLGRWLDISSWEDRTVMRYKGGMLFVTLLYNGPLVERRDVVVLEFSMHGPIEGMLFSACLVFFRIFRDNPLFFYRGIPLGIFVAFLLSLGVTSVLHFTRGRSV